MKPKHAQYLVETTAALLILLFVYTAINKLNDPYTFKAALNKSPILQPFAGALTWLIPDIEIIISITLFIPRTQLFGLRLASLLMTAFTLYVAYMLIFIPHLPCSCGGIIQQMGWKTHLLFNVVITTITIIATKLYKKYYVIRGSRKPVQQSKQSLII